MLRFSLFNSSPDNTSTPNPSSSNPKKDHVTVHDYDSGFKFDVPSYSKQASQKPVNNPTVKSDARNYEDTSRDYSTGVTMPW